MKDYHYPFMNAHLNINVMVGLFHTEHDITYTLCCFPKQINGKSIRGCIDFLFQLNSNMQLKFNIFEGFNEIYSGMLLTHLQDRKNNHVDIMNATGYCNQQFFHHLRSSLKNMNEVSYQLCSFLYII